MDLMHQKRHFQMIVRRVVGLPLRDPAKRPAAATFDESERDLFVDRYCVSQLWFGILSVVSFIVVDACLTPSEFVRFLIARLAVIPIVALSIFAYRFPIVREKFQAWPGYACSLYMGWLMYYLCEHSGHESSLHFMGLLFVALTMGGQSPWLPKQLPVFFALSSAPFWLGVFSWWPNVNKPVVIGDLMMYNAACLLALWFSGEARSMRRNEYDRRKNLHNRTREQQLVIEQKTREGVYLERLASQFSPQVIDSIKSGTLDLDARSRRPVACIFVDVQGSTSRASRIDHHNYTELMAAFFEECVKIFLKHNVTVGTYLGDGILAFTNAPTEDSDYKKNALAACLAILRLHERKQRIYFDTWRTEFNIRIGIDAGYATVGFFPSREHGTYTALGETVSLAARLCARAGTNTVAVTKKFLTEMKMEDGSLEVSRLSTAGDIKGLEGEMFEVFSVRPPSLEKVPQSHCPSCVIPMMRESRQLGASFYCCPTCGFRELVAEGEPAQGDALPFKKPA